jgi:tripartite-type tricarboxylate transporter receptor subunit TctC
MLAPAGTHASIVNHIHASVSQVLKQRDVAELFTRQGLHTYGSSPTEFDEYLRAEIERWTTVISAAEIRVD